MSTSGHHSLPRRHPGIVRQGSSGDSLGVHGHGRVRGSTSSHGHGQGQYGHDDSIDEEVVGDEDDEEGSGERKEHNFGTV
jgi:hypothetical protein